MPKFIKFIANNGMVIVNEEDISTLYFSTKMRSISMRLKKSTSIEFEYNSAEDFKQQCDAIMEQLEI